MRLSALRLAIFPACVALGLYAEWAALMRGPLQEAPTAGEIRLAAADLAVGLVFVVCGLVIWARRENPTGPLFVAVGVSWYLGTFAASGDSGYADFGAIFLTLYRGPLVHALLSYPSGRLERRTEWAAVTIAYVISAIPDIGQSPEGELAGAVIVLGVGTERFVGEQALSGGPARPRPWQAHASQLSSSSLHSPVLPDRAPRWTAVCSGPTTSCSPQSRSA